MGWHKEAKKVFSRYIWGGRKTYGGAEKNSPFMLKWVQSIQKDLKNCLRVISSCTISLLTAPYHFLKFSKLTLFWIWKSEIINII